MATVVPAPRRAPTSPTTSDMRMGPEVVGEAGGSVCIDIGLPSPHAATVLNWEWETSGVMDRDASGLELEGAWAHIHMLQARALSLLLS